MNESMSSDIFLLPENGGDQDAYLRWRDRKLEWLNDTPENSGPPIVDLELPDHSGKSESEKLIELVKKYNFALYVRARSEKEHDEEIERTALRNLGRSVGLVGLDANLYADDDGITSLRVVSSTDNRNERREFIPYTDRPIHWHTDGYYHPPERRIRGLILHCVRPAVQGGENRLLDQEIVYIRLRDRDPELIRALMDPEAMSIPPFENDGVLIRPEITGPVFSVLDDGYLDMRYTARKKNIHWKNSGDVMQAKRILEEILENDAAIVTRRLEENEGLICNNVLHDRSGFQDDPGSPRLLYRLRYLDRVTDSVK